MLGLVSSLSTAPEILCVFSPVCSAVSLMVRLCVSVYCCDGSNCQCVCHSGCVIDLERVCVCDCGCLGDFGWLCFFACV